MICQDAFEAMSAALDDELGPAEREPLRAHLAACAGCREQQVDLRATNRLLRDRRGTLPADLQARIASLITRTPRRSLARAVPVALAAAALAAVTLIGGSRAGRQPRPPVELAAGAPAMDPSATPPSAPRPPQDDRFVLARAPTPANAGSAECRLAVEGRSPVAAACAEGGLVKARATMKGLVGAALAHGTKFTCEDCHSNQRDYALGAGARERFKQLVQASAMPL